MRLVRPGQGRGVEDRPHHDRRLSASDCVADLYRQMFGGSPAPPPPTPMRAVATTYSADETERLRGPQHDAAWCDELAAWRYPEAWDMLMFGMRLGPTRVPW
jgi:hypothetical protein